MVASLGAPSHRRYGTCRVLLMHRKCVRSARQKHMSPVTVFLVLAFIAAAFAAGYFANLFLALALAWRRTSYHDRPSRRIFMRIAPRRRLAASACLLFGASLLAAYAAGVSSQA